MSAARFEQIYREQQQMMGGGPSQFALRLLKMSQKELQDVAVSLGLSMNGSKGELVGRILAYHNAGMNIAPGAERGKMLPRSSIAYGPKVKRGSKVQPMSFEIVPASKPKKRRVIKRAVNLVPGSKVKPMTFKIVQPKKVVAKKAVVKISAKGPCKKYIAGPKCKINKNGACPSKLQIAAAKVNPWLRFMAKFRKESKLKGADALSQGSAIYKQLKASGKLANYIKLAPQGLRVCSKK